MLDRNNNQPSFVTKNINWKTDVEYAMQIMRWLLKSMGIWPLSYQSRGIGKTFARLRVILCLFLICFVLVPGSLFAFVKENNAGFRIKLLGAMSFCMMALVEYVALINNCRDIGECIEHIMADWRTVESSGDRKIMLAHALFGRYGSIICAVCMYSGGFFYVCIIPLLRGTTTIAELNVTIRPLTYPSYYFVFDPQTDPAYKIVFSIQWCAALVIHSIIIVGNSIAVVFVLHACGQLEILVSWLDGLVDGVGKQMENLDWRIARVIDHHVRVLRFVRCVDNVLSTIFLVEIVGCTFGLCLLGHYFLVEWEQSDAVAITTYGLLITSYTFNIFINCYIGDLLTEECRKVGETTYMIEWYRLPPKKALGIVLIISTGQRPASITAGKLIDLSLTTFCTVVRTSVAYLNMLRTFDL